jgi:hypothetical protein
MVSELFQHGIRDISTWYQSIYILTWYQSHAFVFVVFIGLMTLFYFILFSGISPPVNFSFSNLGTMWFGPSQDQRLVFVLRSSFKFWPIVGPFESAFTSHLPQSVATSPAFISFENHYHLRFIPGFSHHRDHCLEFQTQGFRIFHPEFEGGC